MRSTLSGGTPGNRQASIYYRYRLQILLHPAYCWQALDALRSTWKYSIRWRLLDEHPPISIWPMGPNEAYAKDSRSGKSSAAILLHGQLELARHHAPLAAHSAELLNRVRWIQARPGPYPQQQVSLHHTGQTTTKNRGHGSRPLVSLHSMICSACLYAA